MNWGDTLCGVEVTPESWANGVIDWQEQDVRWGMYKPQFNDTGVTSADSDWHVRKFCSPIFPPKGWAGKSDAELWDAVFGNRGERNGRSPLYWLRRCCTGPYVNVSSDGRVWGFIEDDEDECNITDEVPALILALQNAQVLATRLGGAQ